MKDDLTPHRRTEHNVVVVHIELVLISLVIAHVEVCLRTLLVEVDVDLVGGLVIGHVEGTVGVDDAPLKRTKGLYLI